MFSKGLTQCTPVNYSIVDDVLRNSRETRNFKKHFELHTICTQLKWKLSLQTKSSDHLIEILSITTNLKNVRYLHGICTQLKRELSLKTKSTWPPDHLIEFCQSKMSDICTQSAHIWNRSYHFRQQPQINYVINLVDVHEIQNWWWWWGLRRWSITILFIVFAVLMKVMLLCRRLRPFCFSRRHLRRPHCPRLCDCRLRLFRQLCRTIIGLFHRRRHRHCRRPLFSVVLAIVKLIVFRRSFVPSPRHHCRPVSNH